MPSRRAARFLLPAALVMARSMAPDVQLWLVLLVDVLGFRKDAIRGRKGPSPLTEQTLFPESDEHFAEVIKDVGGTVVAFQSRRRDLKTCLE